MWASRARRRSAASDAASAGGGKTTLPRHLFFAILQILRPAEAATRRLIIVLARDIAITLKPLKPFKRPPPQPGSIVLTKDANGQLVGTRIPGVVSPALVGTGIVSKGIPLHKLGLANVLPPLPARKASAAPPLVFPLLDPLRNPFPRRPPRPKRCTVVPRVVYDFDMQRAVQVPKPPSPNDPMDATRLGQRLTLLASVLNDMPAHAKRFAIWQAKMDQLAEERRTVGLRPGRPRRDRALRGGRLRHCRLQRFDPDAKRRKHTRDIDEVLSHCHALAQYAQENRRRYSDTS